jgi:hypothetical protein
MDFQQDNINQRDNSSIMKHARTYKVICQHNQYAMIGSNFLGLKANYLFAYK